MSNGRNFTDWISAYKDYAHDGFSPDKFHLWVGFSVLAAALERKVWATIGEKGLEIFPNLYIFLIAKPAVGKSTALTAGIEGILEKIQTPEGPILFLPEQTSDSAFYETLSKGTKNFNVGTKIIAHSSGYLCVNEASNTFKEMKGGGGILASLTDFYDCKQRSARKTREHGQETILNCCLNMLACCTFNALRMIVPDHSVMGGFASRVMYVVYDELHEREPELEGSLSAEYHRIKQALVEDLNQIHRLSGKFTYEKAMGPIWKNWYKENDRYVQSLKSERLQSLMGRVPTNTLKMAMLCSVSEGNDLVVRVKHWERAREYVKNLLVDLDKVLTAGADGKDQRTLNSVIFQSLGTEGGTRSDVVAKLLQTGIESNRIDSTIALMVNNQLLDMQIRGGKTYFKVLVDPNDYL